MLSSHMCITEYYHNNYCMMNDYKSAMLITQRQYVAMQRRHDTHT